MITSALVTSVNKNVQVTWVIKMAQIEKDIILDWVLYIYYLVQFQKDKKIIIWALIDLGIKVNVMTLAYANQLGLQVLKNWRRGSKN